MLSNHSFDLISTLQNKSEAAAAFDTYVKDAEMQGDQECANLFRTLKTREEEDIDMLRRAVERHAKEGGLR